MNKRMLSKWLTGLLAAIGLASAVHAATTDLADAPLSTSAATTIAPNLMFVMDDSGSMGFDFMPDAVNDQFCRRSGATSANSGVFDRACCQDVNNNGSGSNACWRNAAPFGSWRGHPPFMSSDFNGVYYNPAIVYKPPVDSTGASFASQTAAATGNWTSVKNDAYNVQNTNSIDLTTQFPDLEWCTDNTYTDCLRNGNYWLPGTVNGKAYTTYHATVATGTGSIVVGPSPDQATTQARTWGPHYYKIVPVEYCSDVNLRNCQSTEAGVFNRPAPVRWCNSDANARAASPAANSCQALRTGSYSWARYPTKVIAAATNGTAGQPENLARAQFRVVTANCSNGANGRRVAVSSVRIGGVDIELLATPTATATNDNSLAAAIRAGISAGGTLFTVEQRTDNLIRIFAPSGVVLDGSHIVSLTPDPLNPADQNRRCTFTATPSPIGATMAFGGYAAAVPAVPGTPAAFAGRFERVDIEPGQTSYPRAATRTDCAGATCTYSEEMTNFANWWTYYHTRMQTMKTAASLAFAPVSNQFRLGYISINNSACGQFMNLSSFEGSAKDTWFTKLTAARPNDSTPLRGTLSRVGRLYAGKLTGTTLNGSTVVDPMQFSCQQNFTLLSTDGYWNESGSPIGLDGNAIGDQDSTLPRPLFDGLAYSNSLADVAAYYYETDLRSTCNDGEDDLCTNNVPTSGVDVATHQHMTTFTLGMGVSGYMQFTPNYATALSGDFFSIKNGSAADPSNGICSWQTSGICNWPQPANNSQTNIDDLWHAAVNGRGTYFSASDPMTLATGLQTALASIAAKTGSASAATVSNPNLASGDNFLFSSTFVSAAWTGDLHRRQVSTTDGSLSATLDWSAGALLDARLDAGEARTIYTYDATDTTDGLKSFDWDGLDATQKSYFSKASLSTGATALSQFCTVGIACLTSTQQDAAAGEALVNFLRGDKTNADTESDATKFYRYRVSRLGDIVGSEAVYVKKPLMSYTDAGYSGFKGVVRGATVYVGSNDGMLHAFNADNGQERWAYVPSTVIPRMYRLADKNYRNKHQYFVDSSPVVSDVKIGGVWKTILVGGLGKGGRTYYALDITDPTNPKALWEFTHDNLGYTYGKAAIGKLRNGTWAVFLPSGYNNVSPGDGQGYLFVVNAATGALIGSPIGTGQGSTRTPSGLGHISAWADYPEIDNTIARVYAGDNLGNLWRFDVNNEIAGDDAHLLATLRSAQSNPVTSRPELGTVMGQPVIFVGTGRYLGVSDFSGSGQQSIYAIKDKLASTGYGNPRDTGTFVGQTLTDGLCPGDSPLCSPGQRVRTSSNNAMSFATKDGWYVDLPAGSERVNTDPRLALGTLAVVSNIISSSACTPEGSSYLNYFDYRTGGAVLAARGVASVFLGNYTSSSPNPYGSSTATAVVTQGANGNPERRPFIDNRGAGGTRRLSWRELSIDQ